MIVDLEHYEVTSPMKRLLGSGTVTLHWLLMLCSVLYQLSQICPHYLRSNELPNLVESLNTISNWSSIWLFLLFVYAVVVDHTVSKLNGEMFLSWEDNGGNFFINFSWLRPGTHVFYGRSDSLDVSTSYILATVRCIPRDVLIQLLIFHPWDISTTLSDIVVDFDIQICRTWIVLHPILRDKFLSFTRSNWSQLKSFKIFYKHLSGLSSSPLSAFLKLYYDVISFLLFRWRRSVFSLPLLMDAVFC